jgi:hypothetical protein
VYYKLDDSDIISDSCEHCGCWINVSENVAHTMNFQILSDATIYQSNLWTACYPSSISLPQDPINDSPPVVMQLRHDSTSTALTLAAIKIQDANNLVALTLLILLQDDDQWSCACIVCAID